MSVSFVAIFFLMAIAAGEVCGSAIDKSKNVIKPDPGRIFGVSSVAGVTSRNGRVSTIRAVRFYPPMTSVVKTDDGKSTVSISSHQDKDGVRLSGSSHVYPDINSIVVSAHAGNVPDMSSILGYPKKPFTTNVLVPNDISQIPQHAWFPNEVFEHLMHTNLNVPDYRKHWIMPKFNPFVNFWR